MVTKTCGKVNGAASASLATTEILFGKLVFVLLKSLLFYFWVLITKYHWNLILKKQNLFVIIYEKSNGEKSAADVCLVCIKYSTCYHLVNSNNNPIIIIIITGEWRLVQWLRVGCVVPTLLQDGFKYGCSLARFDVWTSAWWSGYIYPICLRGMRSKSNYDW